MFWSTGQLSGDVGAQRSVDRLPSGGAKLPEGFGVGLGYLDAKRCKILLLILILCASLGAAFLLKV